MDTSFYTHTELTAEEAAEQDRVYGALTAATRAFADAQLRTEVDHAEAEAVTAELAALTERLLAKAMEGTHGTVLGPGDDEVRTHGNAVSGLRNAFATVRREDEHVSEDRVVRYDIHLGAGYEGPPGMVHGGVTALVLDQLLGHAAAAGGGPGMTARLTVHYRRPTPLGPLTLEAWTDRREGRKTFTRGQVKDPDGNVTVEAEGLFIMPRWVTDLPEWQRRAHSFE